jgi:hypothetical protein
MKRVSELYGRHPDSDIYVVGTGTSARVFPLSLLEGKVTIGLNLAWKLFPVRYSITIHPDLCVPEFLPDEEPHPEITWVTKLLKLGQPEQREYGLERFYFFEADGQPSTNREGEPRDAGRILDWVRKPSGDRLYQWSSISQTAANLAANMGARNVFLVGCDNCALLENHHATRHHTRWLGAAPDHRYRQYYEGVAEVRAALRERGVNLVSLTPFAALDRHEEDFVRLCHELDRPEFLPSHDISSAGRPRRRRIRRRLRPVKRALRRMLGLGTPRGG